MAEDYDYQPTAQDMAAVICPQVAAVISMMGSYVIMREVFVDHKQKQGKVIPRILFELCIADLIFSLGWFLGTWPTPSWLPNRWWNYGNMATCSFQAFLLNFGLLASPLFNISLASFSYLMVCCNWRDAKLTKLEPWVHGGIWLFSLAGSIFPIPLGLYNNAWTVCWFESEPAGCKDSFRYGDEATCVRGDNAWVYAVAFTVFPLMVCVILSFVVMGMLYNYVRDTERRSIRHTTVLSSAVIATSEIAATTEAKEAEANPNAAVSDGEPGYAAYGNSCQSETNSPSIVLVEVPSGGRTERWSQYRGNSSMSSIDSSQSLSMIASESERRAKYARSRVVATQGFFYSLSFVATYALHCVATLVFFITGKFWFWFHFGMYFLLSFQGFFNCLVFIRKRNMKTPEGKCLKKILCWTGKVSLLKREKVLSTRKTSSTQGTSQHLPAIQEDSAHMEEDSADLKELDSASCCNSPDDIGEASDSCPKGTNDI